MFFPSDYGNLIDPLIVLKNKKRKRLNFEEEHFFFLLKEQLIRWAQGQCLLKMTLTFITFHIYIIRFHALNIYIS